MTTEKWPDDVRWVSAVAKVEQEEILLRGYPHSQIIGNLTYAESFYLMLRGELPTPQQRRMMDALLCAVPDVGLVKPGTVSARVAMSGNPDIKAGMAVAFLSAGAYTLDPSFSAIFILEQLTRYKDSGLSMDDFAERTIAEHRGIRIPGFGHPFFKRVDPRAAALRKVAAESSLITEHLELYEALHKAFTREPRKAEIPINDVGMSGAILAGMGFAPCEMTGILFTSTLPGIVAHLSEELRDGVRIRVVADELQRYTGVERRELPCREDRE